MRIAVAGLLVALLMPAHAVFCAPKIACDDPVYDFGPVSTGVVSHTFTIWNRGDEPLMTGKLRACCGGTMSVASQVIGPGSNTEVKVTLSLNNRNGQQKKSFYIASNDPNQPYYQLRFVGNAVVPVYFSPASLDFGNLESGKAATMESQLVCSPGVTLQITNVLSTTKEFTASVRKSGDVKSVVVAISTVPPLPKGVTRGEVQILTDNPKYPRFSLRVTASVVGAFVVVPKEIMISGSGSEITRYLAIKTRDESPFTITSIALPENGMKWKAERVGPGSYRCELTGILPYPELDGEELVISTDHPDGKTITVPFKVANTVGAQPPTTATAPKTKRGTPVVADQPVIIDYFYEAGCPDCVKVREQILPFLDERFKGFYVLNWNDVGEKEVIPKLFAYQEKLGITSNEPVCMVVDYQYVFNGFPAIKKGLLQKIDECVAERMVEGWKPPEPIQVSQNAAETLDIAKRRSQGFTIGMVIVAGLADGINPCAIASLVFLMSMLRLSKNAGRGLILMGVAYCLASFITYIAIGFGLLRALHLLDGFNTAQKGIELVLLGILAVLALLSFRDAYRFNVGGNPDDITLQLPKGLKERAHKIMREGLKTKRLILGGLTIGVLVTGIETVCTGQVLVPTLVVVIRESDKSTRELCYLLLYNIMFIVPLVTVFILTYFGLRTQTLLDWSKRNVVFSKVLLGLFFLLMAVLMAVM
jgi:hypothetical protein